MTSSTSVIQQGDYPGLIIDPEDTTNNDSKWEIDLREDTYALHFLRQGHFNFICTDASSQHYVISVLSSPLQGKPGSYRALKTTHKGSEEWDLILGYDPSLSLQETMEGMLIKEGHNCVLVSDPEFCTEFTTVEQKHTQKRTTMKLGMVFCKRGQTEPQIMFSNDDRCTPKFWKFVKTVSTQIDVQNTKKYRGDVREPGLANYGLWNNIEIVYHVAPELSKEETRRLIGNDVGYIFFLDEGWNTRFDPSQVNQFGEVPQVFAVVQPVKDKFRVGFFQKKNILPHGPQPPSRHLTLEEAKNVILTKLYNGLIMTTYCPPLNRLFFKPRQDTLDTICRKYLGGLQRKKSVLPFSVAPSDFKSSIQSSILGSGKRLEQEKIQKLLVKEEQVTFIHDSPSYNPINSLVLLIAANIAYCDIAELKIDCRDQLGFPVDSVFGFNHKITETQGFIAHDKDKMIFVFRGAINETKMKKSLAHGKKGKIEIKRLNLVLPGQVFNIFAKSMNSIWEKIDVVMSKLYQNQKIFLCGHDSGGCLAILAAHILELRGAKVTAVYTFGSPKVGDLSWSQAYPASLNQNTFRVAHHSDFVPAHPSERYWYHVGKLQTIGSAHDRTPNPHSIECYFNVLSPAHKSAIDKMSAVKPLSDRIVESTINIRERISRREAYRPRGGSEIVVRRPTQTEKEIDIPEAEKHGINVPETCSEVEVEELDEEQEDEREGLGEVFDEDALVSRGLKKASTMPRFIRKPAQPVQPRQVRRRSTGHMEPILPLALLSFFKSNLFSLLSTYHKIRAIVYGNVPSQEFEDFLLSIARCIKTMDSVLLKLTSNHMDEEAVMHFVEKNREFLVLSGQFLRICTRICKNGNYPPAQNLIDEFNKRFSSILPIAKEISDMIKILMTKEK